MSKRKFISTILSIVLFSGFSLTALAGLEVREFTNPEQEQRYHKLIDELRCLVCQNQNLADSNSQLALDLRNKVYEMVSTNKTDQEVIDYMVERYGEYVLYNPPLDSVTAILWVGPFLAIFIAIFWLLFYIAKRNNIKPASLSDDERKRSKKLLNEEKDDEK